MVTYSHTRVDVSADGELVFELVFRDEIERTVLQGGSDVSIPVA